MRVGAVVFAEGEMGSLVMCLVGWWILCIPYPCNTAADFNA